MRAIERFDSRVIEQIQHVIKDARGQEVLFAGSCDSSGTVVDISTGARGTERQVPALMEFMERGDAVIHNHPSGDLRPSDADLKVASMLGNAGIGFIIVDNPVDDIYVVAEPVGKKNIEPLDTDKMISYLDPKGSIAKFLPAYEAREVQVDLLQEVCRAFNEDSITAVEAGTGVGKSLAYGIPAVQWGDKNEERVVISTATINLQQQLIEKDIPLIKSIIGSRVKVVLVKGRGNYVCLKRLKELPEEDSLFNDENETFKAIRKWAETSKDGSKSDLSFYPDSELWSRICSESDACLGIKCGFRDSCFVLRARKDAASAKVLVVNHHLLFSDLSMRAGGVGYDSTAVLPPFRRIIFDEAHNIESAATSFFSEQFNRFSLFKQLNRVFARKGNRTMGLLIKLLPGKNNSKRRSSFFGVIEDIRSRAENLDQITAGVLGHQYTLRISGEDLSEGAIEALEMMKMLQTKLVDLINHISKLVREKEDQKPEEEGPAAELKLVLRRLEGFSSVLETFRDYKEIDDKVLWIEKRYQRGKTSSAYNYIATPIDITGVMKEVVYEPYKTIFFTSATLTVNASFHYWFSRVGLSSPGMLEEKVRGRLLESPFPYQTNVFFGIPKDGPEPKSEEYQNFVIDTVAETLELSEGKGLVLFTSYAMLEKTYEGVKNRMDAKKIPVLKQGSDDRAKLLARFNREISSVLFATESFWQGVDAPGETCGVVIMCRLPFRVPSNPVIRARMEAIEKEGGNAFMDYSLPEAVMRFKQGFGRLMRKQSDRGAVLVLDKRITTKAYGRIFLSSLPPTIRLIGSWKSVLTHLEEFLYP